MKKVFTPFPVIAFLLLIGLSAKSQVFVIQPGNVQWQDTYVSSIHDSSNYSNGAYMLFAGYSGQADTLNLFIKFDLSSITPETSVSSARLDLYRIGQNGSMNGFQFGVYRVIRDWDEDTLYWYNQPLANLLPDSVFSGDEFQQGAPLAWRSIYIPKSIVQYWINNPSANYGIKIAAVNDFYGAPLIASSENSDSTHHPRLVINSSNSKFTGIVADSLTAAPLQNIVLTAFAKNNPVALAKDTTDSAGAFELDVIYPDTFYIQVDGINGYLPRILDSLILTEGQNKNLSVKLMPDAHAVGGQVGGTWTYANSPYKVSSNIYIPDASELIIEPGVDIVFQGHYGIYVEGSLHAVGTLSDSIAFTSEDTTIESRGRGIHFSEADSCYLKYCLIENGYSFDNIWGQSNTDQGGGISSDNSDLLIEKSTVRNNFANTGGGIFCRNNNSSRNFTARQNLIENNRTVFNGTIYDGGAGIMVYATSAGGITIDNNVIRNNTYQSDYYGGYEGGGGIYVVGQKADIINNTIVKNSAVKGSGLYLNGFTGNVKNNIIWGNYGSLFKEQIAINVCSTCMPDAELSIQYNAIEDTAIRVLYQVTPLPVYYSGIGNIPAYPVFADTLANNFRLQPTSPCIDNGNNVFVKFFEDFTGNCRVYDGNNDHQGKVDMGAYEYNSNHYLVAPELGNNDSTCANVPLTIQTGTFAGYSWNTGATGSYILASDISSEYFVTVTDSLGCFAWDSVYIKILPLHVAHITGDTLQCFGNPAHLATENGFSSYLWNGFDSGTFQYSTLLTGNYWVNVTGLNGCASNSDTVHVDIFNLHEINLGPDITMHLTESVILNAGHGYENYSWNTGANTEMVTIFASHLGTGTHLIWVRASNTAGCLSQDSIFITILNNVGIDENISENICAVSPNPARDKTEISLPSSWKNSEVNITMTDITGRIVKVFSSGGFEKVFLNLNGISSGLYQLTLTSCDKICKAKLIVE